MPFDFKDLPYFLHQPGSPVEDWVKEAVGVEVQHVGESKGELVLERIVFRRAKLHHNFHVMHSTSFGPDVCPVDGSPLHCCSCPQAGPDNKICQAELRQISPEELISYIKNVAGMNEYTVWYYRGELKHRT